MRASEWQATAPRSPAKARLLPRTRLGKFAPHGCLTVANRRAARADVPDPASRMSWWRRLLGESSAKSPKPQRLDYLAEAIALERQNDYDGAITSYRLALRDRPNDPRILQNMAIAYSRLGRLEDAIRSYRRALTFDPQLSGAHYGLAFLLLKKGDDEGAKQHLTTFLQHPPAGDESERWIAHARQTLAALEPAQDAGATHSDRD